MNLDSVSFFGQGLSRPECVLAHRSGAFFCSDSRGNGGVAIVGPSGDVLRLQARGLNRPLHPNGIALRPDGSFLIAHLGAEDGGVWTLAPDGSASPFLIELDGRPLPPTNYVHHDAMGRTWISVSTRLHPRTLAYRPGADDGYVILVDDNGARIVADGLGYTNECVVDDERELFFINETFGRRISRYRIASDGSLTDRTIVATFGAGTYPDGLSLDVEGGLWVTSVVSNRLIRVAPDGAQTAFLEDMDGEYVARVEAAFVADRMDLSDITAMPESRLRNISCLAFAGSDLQTGVLGSLGNDKLGRLNLPIAGRRPAHFDYDLTGLNYLAIRGAT